MLAISSKMSYTPISNNNQKQNNIVFRAIPLRQISKGKEVARKQQTCARKVLRTFITVLSAGAVSICSNIGKSQVRERITIPKAQSIIAKGIKDTAALRKIFENGKAIKRSKNSNRFYTLVDKGSRSEEKYLKEVEDSLNWGSSTPNEKFAKDIERGMQISAPHKNWIN